MLDRKRSIFIGLLSLLLLSTALSAGASSKKAPGPTAKGDPAQGKHLFNHYCAVCHGLSGKGNGVNADNLDPHPANLTSGEVAGLSDEEIYVTIEKGGAAVELSAGMPPWGRTLSKDQIQNIIAYIRTSLQKKGEAEAETGIRLSDVQRSGEERCGVCHVKQGEPRAIAPNLGFEGTKLNREWLRQFLKDPGRIRPVGYIPLTKARMPNFQFSDEEVSALVDFLMTRRDPGISQAGLAGFKPSDPAEIEKGKRLFVDKYACDACHRTGGNEGGVVGPNLGEAARRLRPEWIFYWIRNPQAIRPDAPMPNFGASDGEIRSLIAYILSVGQGAAQKTSGAPLPDAAPAAPAAPNEAAIKKGEKMVKEKNCLACHTLDSYNSQQKRPAPETLPGRSSSRKGPDEPAG